MIDNSGVREQFTGDEAVAYDRSIDVRRAKCFAGHYENCGLDPKGLTISGPDGNNILMDGMLRIGAGLTLLSGLSDAAACGGGNSASCAMAALPFLKLKKLAKLLGRADDANDARKATEAASGLKGAIPDAVPANLTQQLALAEARASGGTQIMANLADEPRLIAVYGEG